MNEEYAQMYIEKGEFWENNPMAYVEALKADREGMLATLTDMDHIALMRAWDDRTLFDVEYSGSDLAGNKALRSLLVAAARYERNRRWVLAGGRIPTGLGMGADGGQA